MKKIISLILAVLLLCTLAVPVFADEAPTAYNAVGEGTSEKPWEISTLDQLNSLADVVNGGNKMEGKYFVLTADIASFTGTIGKSASKPFNGHFDGQEHTVTLKVENTREYVGLFGYLDSGAVISNVNTAGSIKGDHSVAGICGDNYGTIIRCNNSAVITANYNNAGGICGVNKGTISDCSNSGKVHGGNSCSGGICAQNYGTVSNCVSVGKLIPGHDCSGGITGYNGKTGTVNNCYYNSDKCTVNDSGVGTGIPTIVVPSMSAVSSFLALLNVYIDENPGELAREYKWEATEDGSFRLVPATTGEQEQGSPSDDLDANRLFKDGDYKIYSVLNNEQGGKMCVDIDGTYQGKNSGDNVHLWDNGAAYNVFTLTWDTYAQAYIIKAKHSGLVLEAAGGSTENGSNVQQLGDNGSDTQRWVFESADNGNYFIHTKQNDYMDAAECVNGKKPVNDTNIQVCSFTGETNQQFILEKQAVSNVGSALSEGNLTLIIAIAAAAVFGLGGFFAGNTFAKKKTLATANSAPVDNKEDEE